MAADSNKTSPQVPLGALAVNVLGTLLATAGIVGLLVPDLARHVPALTDALTAWTLLVVGLALDAWSVRAIIARLRR